MTGLTAVCAVAVIAMPALAAMVARIIVSLIVCPLFSPRPSSLSRGEEGRETVDFRVGKICRDHPHLLAFVIAAFAGSKPVQLPLDLALMLARQDWRRDLGSVEPVARGAWRDTPGGIAGVDQTDCGNLLIAAPGRRRANPGPPPDPAL
jgi:hypothetical protein